MSKILSNIYLQLKKILRRSSCVEEKLYFYNCSEVDENSKKLFYPVENVTALSNNNSKQPSFVKSKQKHAKGCSTKEARQKWDLFIANSIITEGYRNEGLAFGGFIEDCNSWCLPSWVWTNAAIVRYFLSCNRIKDAEVFGEKLLELQNEDGSWTVRNDYTSEGEIPIVAPNDSAYIANNACISLYKNTKKEVYLNSAIRCADWIMSTARNDGLVYFGYDCKNNRWIKEKNIVDIGFTAGLFSEIYKLTKNQEYLVFLEKFLAKYIEAFYDEKSSLFCTAIEEERQKGGFFARGQAWALEGLIPSFDLLRDDELKNIIEANIKKIILMQNIDGSWPYNLSRKWMGSDCKGTPVIAYSLSNWLPFSNDKERLSASIERALDWCATKTAINGKCEGGIFSFTYEGAVVHHLNTETAFVYSSSYAAEIYDRFLK